MQLFFSYDIYYKACWLSSLCSCVRNGNYDEALDLEAFVCKLSTMHPKWVISVLFFSLASICFGCQLCGRPLAEALTFIFKVTCYSSTGCRSQADNPVSSLSASPETSLKYSGIQWHSSVGSFTLMLLDSFLEKIICFCECILVYCSYQNAFVLLDIYVE